MKCPHCGYQNPDGEMFCGYCSKETKIPQKKAEETTRVCVSCGRPIGWNDYACQHCGHVYGRQIPEKPKAGAHKMRQCVFCGRAIDWQAQICMYCGYDYRKSTAPRNPAK